MTGSLEPQPSFHCKQCGTCCRWPGYVYLTEEDISAMADALELDERAFIARHTRLAPDRKRLCLNEEPDGACVWLEDSRCTCYAVRPAQCREYPFRWKPDDCCLNS